MGAKNLLIFCGIKLLILLDKIVYFVFGVCAIRAVFSHFSQFLFGLSLILKWIQILWIGSLIPIMLIVQEVAHHCESWVGLVSRDHVTSSIHQYEPQVSIGFSPSSYFSHHSPDFLFSPLPLVDSFPVQAVQPDRTDRRAAFVHTRSRTWSRGLRGQNPAAKSRFQLRFPDGRAALHARV